MHKRTNANGSQGKYGEGAVNTLNKGQKRTELC